MSFKPNRLLPSSLIEYISLGVVTLLVIVIGNSHQLISYYGLTPSTNVIRTTTSGAVNHALAKLDSFSITQNVVTFGIWAMVGVFTLSFIRGIGRVWQEIEYDEEVTSKHYIHPRVFTRAKFWRQVIIDFFGVMSYLLLLVLLVYAAVAFILPVGLAYTRSFLLNVSFRELGGMIIGTIELFLGVLVFYIYGRAFINRRHLFDDQAE